MRACVSAFLPPQTHSAVDAESAPADEHGFISEAWSPVLTIATLKESSTEAFLPAAARFCNARLWGTLSAAVFVHPEDEAAHRAAFQDFLGEMRYGSVGVNTLTALNFSINKLPWGAFPGHTLADIQSGVGQASRLRFGAAVPRFRRQILCGG